MLSYDGGVQHAKGFASRKERALKTIAPNAETYQMMKKAGLNMEIFSGGGTRTYNIMHEVPGSPTCRWAATCSWTCSTWPSAARTATPSTPTSRRH